MTCLLIKTINGFWHLLETGGMVFEEESFDDFFKD